LPFYIIAGDTNHLIALKRRLRDQIEHNNGEALDSIDIVEGFHGHGVVINPRLAQKDKQERWKGTSFFTFETTISKGLLLWYQERLLYQKHKLIENGKFSTTKVPFLLMRCYQYRLPHKTFNANPGAEREKEIMWKQGKRRGVSAVAIFLGSSFVFVS
jgi:hypothetical protein